jgi:hypothetical protein
MALGTPGPFLRSSLSRVALAGTIVAYAEGHYGIDAGCTDIAVVDVAAKHTLRRLGHVACTIDAGFIRLGQVTDLVVTSRGSVAWIASKGKYRAQSFEVRRARSSGRSVLLDEGPEIEPESLRRSGAVVSWAKGGHRLSAPLA